MADLSPNPNQQSQTNPQILSKPNPAALTNPKLACVGLYES